MLGWLLLVTLVVVGLLALDWWCACACFIGSYCLFAFTLFGWLGLAVFEAFVGLLSLGGVVVGVICCVSLCLAGLLLGVLVGFPC